MWQFAGMRFMDQIQYFLRFADPINFCGLKTSTNSQIHNFLRTYLAKTRSIPMCVWIRNTDFFSLQICGFVFGGLGHQGNLQICYCGMNTRICGFAMCGLAKNLRAAFVSTNYVTHLLLSYCLILWFIIELKRKKNIRSPEEVRAGSLQYKGLSTQGPK
jgi:hypothetical protein